LNDPSGRVVVAENGARFQIFKHRRNGHPGVTENPCAATSPRHTFHGGTLRPIQTRHIGLHHALFETGQTEREGLDIPANCPYTLDDLFDGDL